LLAIRDYGSPLIEHQNTNLPGVSLDLPPDLTKDLALSGFEDAPTKQLLVVKHILEKSRYASLKPILPLLLNLKGEPYGLNDYFPFEPFFRTRMPRKTVLKTGRQVSKSTSLAARGVVQSNCIPYFSTLYITPLYEMIRRFSQNYMRPFIETSPVKDLLIGKTTVNSVLQRTFRNNSQMLFSFAFMDCERTRGVSADQINYDEVQDLDVDFIPIIRETTSGSKYGGIETYAGTPKTMEGALQVLWNDSSQAEWVMRCGACNYLNVPALSHDLEKMIGPYRDDICEQRPGVICAKCRRPINPRDGRWVHAYGDRRWKFAGYHIPQILMPMHYANHEKWDVLLGKQQGRGNTPTNVFFNEVCGESFDTGAKLVTVTDLKAAAVLKHKNRIDEAAPLTDNYIHRVLAVDWGGGGADGVSWTVLTALGMLSNGRINCIWGLRSLTPHDHLREARLVMAAATKFKAQAIAHDYTGAGSLRETFIVQAGYPLDRIVPVAYVRAGRSAVMQYKPATAANPRAHYQVDKSRSLLLTCNQIKNGWLQFFQYDYENVDTPGLLHDFLALVEDKTDSRLGKDLYTIIRDPALHDDFAQAVNIGCCTLWQLSGKWPDIASVAKMEIPVELVHAVAPRGNATWDGS
jgi:hypothetical protein